MLVAGGPAAYRRAGELKAFPLPYFGHSAFHVVNAGIKASGHPRAEMGGEMLRAE